MAIMFLFGVLCLAVIAAIGYAVVKDALIGSGAAVVLAILAGITLFFGGYNPVGTKEIGVVQSFGHTNGVVGPGFHWIAPWENVIPIDETVQTDTWALNPAGLVSGPSSDVSSALPVRLGGQQEGYLDMKMKWRILDAGAPELYKNYSRSGDFMTTIRHSVVWYDLQNVVNHVLGNYNPIFDVSTNSQAGQGTSQFSTFDTQVQQQMQSDLAGQIDVLSVSFQYLHYDASTQARLNQIQQQYALTAIAIAQLATNEAQSKANAAIAHSISTLILQQQCLGVAEQAIKAGNSSAQPGLCLSGSGGVITSLGKG